MISLSIKKCVAGLSLLGFIGAVQAADPIRIGFLGTLSGSLAGMGQDQYDGFMLALAQKHNVLGGRPVEMFREDDELKPDVGLQAAQKLIEEDKVDIITGVSYSNVMMAIHKPITDAKVFLIGSASGPSPMAGASCSPYFFSTSWQNDQMSEAVAQYVNREKYQHVYAIGTNFQGWKDALAGFKRAYSGQVVRDVATQMNQPDYSAEIAQIAANKPDAVFASYSGGMGVKFIKQYQQAGLLNKIPLIVVATVDGLTLPALGRSAMGVMTAQTWSPDLKNPQNQQFVAAFEARYKRIPSNFAAQSYDAAQLLDSAIARVKGNINDKAAFRKALQAADFKSVRGDFAFNTNQFPIEDFHLLEVGLDTSGRVSMIDKGVLLAHHKDAFYQQCKM